MIDILNYNVDEICTLYRNADKNINKLKLLQELTLLKRSELIKILERNGYKINNKASRKKYSREELLNYYNQGLNDTEISRAMGCSESTVNGWRQENGLENNYLKKFKKSLREQANKK